MAEEIIRPPLWDIPDGLHCALRAHKGRIQDRKDAGCGGSCDGEIDVPCSQPVGVTYKSVYVAEGNDEMAACDKSEE